MLVRELTVEDAPALRQLRMEALSTAPTAFGAEHEEATRLTDDDFRKRIEGAAPGATFGAFDRSTLIGMAGLFVEKGGKTQHKGYMWGVFVKPAYRGQGVARALVRAVIAKASGVVVVLQSAVVTENAGAAALYASLGFATFGIEKKALFVDGVYYDEAHIALDFSES